MRAEAADEEPVDAGVGAVGLGVDAGGVAEGVGDGLGNRVPASGRG